MVYQEMQSTFLELEKFPLKDKGPVIFVPFYTCIILHQKLV